MDVPVSASESCMISVVSHSLAAPGKVGHRHSSSAHCMV